MRTIQVAGGDLYRLAATYLGDATQWTRIAQANGLSDPVLAGVATLKLPAADAGATSVGGGVAGR